MGKVALFCKRNTALVYYFLAVILVFIAAAVAIKYFKWSPKTSFEMYSNDADKPILYFFLMDGCGWCDKLKPHVTAVQNKVSSDSQWSGKVDVAIVKIPTSVAEDKELQKEFAINAFPTIVLSRKDRSKYWTYHQSQERTAEAILQWVETTLDQ